MPNLHEKNDFAEGFKILLDPKIILLDHLNNFIGILKITNNVAKDVDILVTSLSILRNYLVQQNVLICKLFFLSSAKILDLSAKSFFPCSSMYRTVKVQT